MARFAFIAITLAATFLAVTIAKADVSYGAGVITATLLCAFLMPDRKPEQKQS
jgi:hypothetical protein